MTWRKSGFTPAEEMLALLIERQDDWFRVLAAPVTGSKRLQVPGPIEIPRPGDEQEPERKKIETDPAKIAAFFQKHIHREGG